MSYLLISWDVDNSVSVVNKNSKGIVTLDESQSRISFKWPRKGVYDGKIVAMSGAFQFCRHCSYLAIAAAELLTQYVAPTYASYIFLDSKKEMDTKAIELTKSATASCLEEQATITSNDKYCFSCVLTTGIPSTMC